ncbi:MAG: 30S ribosomal protein S5 [Puniceicoccales bacterium]|jgi:small subunit ribosomal protein S5|nr:30S ribosomal protein S5 [Puniceicoccales bacterium]
MDTKARRHFQRERKTINSRTAENDVPELKEKVVHIGRCSKVMKGGRRFSFSALVVVGNQNGRLGMGTGRAHEVPEAVRKATEHARKNLHSFALRNGTVPHGIVGRADGGCVLLRPATDGTGVVAGGGVRAVLEVVGVRNVLSKSMRSSNPHATVRATIDALSRLRLPEEVRALRKCVVGRGSESVEEHPKEVVPQ